MCAFNIFASLLGDLFYNIRGKKIICFKFLDDLCILFSALVFELQGNYSEIQALNMYDLA